MTTYEDPAQGGAEVAQNSEGTVLRLPPRPNWLVTLFLGGWLIAWFFEERSASQQLMNGSADSSNLLLIGWLVAWTAGGAMAFYQLIWQALASQYLQVGTSSLSTWSSMLGLRFARKNYRLSDVKNLRSFAGVGTDAENGSWRKVSIAFDYGNRTVLVFGGIDEAEAEAICRQLKAASPQLRLTARTT